MPEYQHFFQNAFPAGVHYVYSPIARLPGLPATRSSRRSEFPVWSLQSIPFSSRSSLTPSPHGPPEAPRPTIIPLPAVDDIRPRNVEFGRPSTIPRKPSTVGDARFDVLDQPSIDPLLALPKHSRARPSLQWDLLYDPTTTLLNDPSIAHAGFRRSAVFSSGGLPLQSLVLIFPLLPIEIKIRPMTCLEFCHARNSTERITVGDVLEGLYLSLREPIQPSKFLRLNGSEQDTLLRASEVRCRNLPEDAHSRHALRAVNYLARRRRFLGIRRAMPYELPRGRVLEEVYVVEVGTGER